MSEMHYYGLVRFSKKTGAIDTTMTALGKGLIQLWGLQNTTKTKACVVVDINERQPVMEYVGTNDGFPKVNKTPEEFEFNVPEGLYDVFDEEVAKRKAEKPSLSNQVQNAEQKAASSAVTPDQGGKEPEKNTGR